MPVQRRLRRSTAFSLCAGGNLATDPHNPTRWLEVRGAVVGETEEGADEHIDELARLYLGVDKYPFHRGGDVRVLFRIAAERVATMESAMSDFTAST
jgi:hypothetical protein